MSNFFTKSIPKRPEVTGTPEQAFCFVGDFTNTVVKLVQTKTISAYATVTSGLTTLQYLINPQIHFNLTGTPTTIIRNASNKKREFCLAKIDLESICLFLYITAKNDFDSLLVHGDDIPQELPGETNNLKSFSNPLVATLIPNFVAIYYGQKIPHGDITNNEVKAKLLHLGTLYDLWGQIVEETLSNDSIGDCIAVMEEAVKDSDHMKRYSSQSYDPNSPTKLSSFTTDLVVQLRTCNPMTILRQQLRSRNSSLMLRYQLSPPKRSPNQVPSCSRYLVS